MPAAIFMLKSRLKYNFRQIKQQQQKDVQDQLLKTQKTTTTKYFNTLSVGIQLDCTLLSLLVQCLNGNVIGNYITLELADKL